MKHILLIDNHREYIHSIGRSLHMLLGDQYDFAYAYSADQAAEQIDNILPDVIISELFLDSTNFVTLLNELTSYDDTRGIPKIILTAHIERIDLEVFAQFSVIEAIDKKTLDITELANSIQRALWQG